MIGLLTVLHLSTLRSLSYSLTEVEGSDEVGERVDVAVNRSPRTIGFP